MSSHNCAQAACSESVNCVKEARFLACGTDAGTVVLRDPVTLRVERQVASHIGSITGMDVKGEILITSGLTTQYCLPLSLLLSPSLSLSLSLLLSPFVSVFFPVSSVCCNGCAVLMPALCLLSMA